jgi:hypothetical protein
MSKHKSNVHTDHYKTAGREPQGRDVLHSEYKQEYAQSRSSEEQEDPRKIVTTEANAQSGPGTDAGQQTSAKSGKRSSSQKGSSTRHVEGSAPAARPTSGAFGREVSGRTESSKKTSRQANTRKSDS